MHTLCTLSCFDYTILNSLMVLFICAQTTACLNMTNTNNNPTVGQKFLSRKTLAERWDVSYLTITRLEKQGVLNPVALSERSIRYRIEDIEKHEQEARS